MPMMIPQAQFTFPKLILFLTEQEYEKLGIDFDVNQIFELELSGQAIKFRKLP